jgi:hypothetical protein
VTCLIARVSLVTTLVAFALSAQAQQRGPFAGPFDSERFSTQVQRAAVVTAASQAAVPEAPRKSLQPLRRTG